MLRRTVDGTFLSEVANHPEVRPHVGGEGEIALNAMNPANLFLQGEYGGFVFLRLAPGLFEVHSLVLPAGRGRWALKAMLEAREILFSITDCLELVTKVPDANRAARGLAIMAGMREAFRRENTSYMTLGWLAYAMKAKETLTEGRRFHDWLESVNAHSDHPDDEVHDRVVGASLLRARGGLPKVGLSLYNRWAVFAGYAALRLVSEAPVEFDMQDAIVRLHGNGTLELLNRCPSARS